LRALIPAPLGDALPEAETSEALGRRCAARLIEFANRLPLVLIFEQLDDADASSLALLEALAERLEGAPLLLVLTMTPSMARSLMAARAATRLRMPASALVVELDPISEADIQIHLALQLPNVAAERHGELAAALRRLSGGNGLLLSELTRAIEDGEIDAAADISDLERLPTSLMGVAQHRVALLAGAAVETLELAALAGEVIRPELLFDLLPRSANDITADLESAIERGLLADTTEGGLRFRHGIFREALIRRQSSLRRRRRHQEIANWLAARQDARPEDIGHHAEQAGDYALAYDAFLRAGEAAERVFALPEAARDYRRAVTLGGRAGVDDATLDDLRLRIADALLLTDRDAARREITRVATRADLRGDARLLARAQQRRAVLLYEDGHASDAQAMLEEILPALAAGDDHRAHALALTYAGYCYGSANDLPALDRVAGELVELAAGARQPAYRAMALQFQAGVLVARGEPAAAPSMARESVEIMAELGRYDRATDYAAVALMRVDIPSNLAQPDAVDALLRRGEELQALRNERLGAELPYEPAFLALRFLRGDWAQTRQVLSDQTAQGVRDHMPGVVRDILHNVAADLALAEGRAADADAGSALIAPAPADGPGEHSLPQWLSAVDRRITLALQRSDLDGARAWHVALERALARRQHAPGAVLSTLIAAQLSLAHGQLERANQLARQARDAARASDNLLLELRAQRVETAVLRQRADVNGALAVSRLAAAEAEAARLPYYALLNWLDAAEAAATLADTRAEAVALVDRCLAGSTLLGAFAARQLALRVRERLQAVRTDWPAGVTAREVDVLRLLALGLADRAIAERLFISPRTVTTHVGNLLGKTATANRTELAMWAVQQGLVTPEPGEAGS
jgi:DNA-binding CsgD family transcriptional regulator